MDFQNIKRNAEEWSNLLRCRAKKIPEVQSSEYYKSVNSTLQFFIVTNATICRLSKISFLETTEKYATLMKRYTAMSENIASGAARLIVRTGSRTSDNA